MIYVKMSTGAVSKLVALEDEVKQFELSDRGFEYVLGPDGLPVTVSSDELACTGDPARLAMIKAVKAKYNN